MKSIPLFRKTSYLLLLSIAIIIITAFSASASHFRYGNITWKRVPGTTDKIEYKISQAWRKSFFGGTLNVGSLVSTGTFYTGIGFMNVNLEITSINAAEDWFYGEFTTIVTYASAGNYQAYFDGCCRISTLKNNADDEFKISTSVTVGNGNDAPVTTISPYINLAIGNTNATYQLASTDPNGDAVTYSLTPNNAFGAGTVQPAGLTVSPSGLISFNTNAPGIIIGNLYNANITVQDSKGAITMIDFIIKTTAVSTPPVFDYAITPANSQVYNIIPGQALNFPLKATDADSGQSVNISAVGMPVGSIYNNLNGNPATAGFNWTPTLGDLGNYVLHFTATDNVGASTPTVVFLNVTADPVFTNPTPGNNSIYCVAPGAQVSYSYYASDPDTLDELTLQVHSGLQAGMQFSPTLPIMNMGEVSTGFSWSPSASQWGLHLLTMRVEDSYGIYQDNTVHFLVNNAPAITSVPTTTVNVGATYNYIVTTQDLDKMYGDTVVLESSMLPSFLSITDNGDGTFTISGTPSNADVGTHFIKVEIEDSLNHYNGTHCGNAYQTYNLEVLPCDLTTTVDASTNNNIPGHPNNTIYVGYGNQSATLTASTNGVAPISYNWSTGGNTPAISVSPTTTTTYTVIITDGNGCKDTASYTVPVIDVRCGNNNNKVKICHKTGNGYHELCIAAPAVPAHLAHGDYLGACMEAMAGMITTNNTQSMQLYPNPSKSELVLSLSFTPVAGELKVYDATGRLVYAQNITTNNTTIPVSVWAAGLYLVEYSDQNILLRDRLIKE